MGGVLLLFGCAASRPPVTPPPELPDIDGLWDFAHPDSTEAAFRALVPAARRSGNSDYLAQLLTQLARTQSLQMRFDDAHRILDEVEGMLTDELESARVHVLLERGRTLNSAGQPDRARPLFREAWQRARTAGLDALAVDAAHMVAIVESPDAGLRWIQRAIALAESSTDAKAREWLGSLYNNLGWTLHARHDYRAALDIFRKTRAWEQDQGRVEEERIARWSIARTLRSLGRPEEALALQRKLRVETDAAGGRDGFVYEELAECLWALKREAEARPFFAVAWDELSQDPWLRANESGRLHRLRELSGVAD